MYMDNIRMEYKLNTYKQNKALVDTTMLRISELEKILRGTGDDVLELVIEPPEEVYPGMPKVQGQISKPVEVSVLKREVAREIVQKWINDDKRDILVLKLEVEQIESALNALSREQLFVVESKFFEKWTWSAIEKEFNEKFRNVYNSYVGDAGIRKIKREAVGILCNILRNFYKCLHSDNV